MQERRLEIVPNCDPYLVLITAYYDEGFDLEEQPITGWLHLIDNETWGVSVVPTAVIETDGGGLATSVIFNTKTEIWLESSGSGPTGSGRDSMLKYLQKNTPDLRVVD